MQAIENDEFEFIEENDSTEARTAAPKKMVKEERLNSVFGLPLQEKIVKTFPCFLVAEILIQGSMLVTEHHICFYSNIPGLRRNVKIKFSSVTAITKEKVYAIFPTAIGIRTREEKTSFSFVTSRDKLLQLLHSRWQHAAESEDDCGSSAQNSVVEEGIVATEPASGCQAAGVDSLAMNDEDSGIAVLPSGDSADDFSDGVDAAADNDSQLELHNTAETLSLLLRLRRALEAGGGTHRGVAVISVLLVLSAVAVIVLSVRLHHLQHQMLELLAEQRTEGLSDHEQLQFVLGGMLQSLGGLQEKLTALRQSLQLLPAGAEPKA